MPDAGKKAVDAYIAAAPKAAQPRLRQLRKLIRETAPSATERISYGMPYYDHHGPLVYFSAFPNHIGLYPAGQAERSKELKEYVTGKGTFRFPMDRPLPVAKIARLVRRRVKENEARTKARPG